MSSSKPTTDKSLPTSEVQGLRAEVAALRNELAEQERLLEVVAESTTEMLWRTDAEHRFTYMSNSVTVVAQLPLRDQIGQTRVELSSEDTSAAKWLRHVDDLNSHRPFTNFQYTRRREDGTVRHIITSGKPTFDDADQFIGYIGVASDITDRVNAEARVESAESTLITAIDSVDALFSVWDADDRLVLMNEEFRKLNERVPEGCRVGITFEEHFRVLAENGLVDLNGASAEDTIADRLAQHRNPGRPFEVGRQDDRTVLIHEARTADGMTIIMSMDISAQKKTEAALRQSEQRLRDFGSTAADWFWECGPDLRFTYISADNRPISGLTPEDHYGKTHRETGLQGITEKELDAHERQLERREPFYNFRYMRRRQDGKKVYLSINGKPIFSEDGTFLGYRGVGRDITELVIAENAILDEKDRAEQASRAKSEFLAHMSHELRTPLNAILGFSEIIREQTLGPVGHKSYAGYADDIHSSGQHLLSLIDDLLDLSKIEAGKLDLEEQVVDIAEALLSSNRLFQQRLDRRGIKFNCEIASDATHIRGDQRALTQILFNVMSNAEKFNADGGRIDVRVVRDDDGILLSIFDNGCGFNVNDLQTALAPFGRIRNPLTRSVSGTGLGLPIVKALMEMHDGELSIESEPGNGTCVTLHFPPERTITGAATRN